MGYCGNTAVGSHMAERAYAGTVPEKSPIQSQVSWEFAVVSKNKG